MTKTCLSIGPIMLLGFAACVGTANTAAPPDDVEPLLRHLEGELGGDAWREQTATEITVGRSAIGLPRGSSFARYWLTGRGGHRTALSITAKKGAVPLIALYGPRASAVPVRLGHAIGGGNPSRAILRVRLPEDGEYLLVAIDAVAFERALADAAEGRATAALTDGSEESCACQCEYFPPPDLGPPAWMPPVREERCEDHYSESACRRYPSCGWCSERRDCLEGDEHGPAVGSCDDWRHGLGEGPTVIHLEPPGLTTNFHRFDYRIEVYVDHGAGARTAEVLWSYDENRDNAISLTNGWAFGSRFQLEERSGKTVYFWARSATDTQGANASGWTGPVSGHSAAVDLGNFLEDSQEGPGTGVVAFCLEPGDC